MLEEGEAALPGREQALLDRICSAYYLPAWCSIADYERLMRDAGMQVQPLGPAPLVYHLYMT